jgi:hypothetical protein
MRAQKGGCRGVVSYSSAYIYNYLENGLEAAFFASKRLFSSFAAVRKDERIGLRPSSSQ